MCVCSVQNYPFQFHFLSKILNFLPRFSAKALCNTYSVAKAHRNAENVIRQRNIVLSRFIYK